MMYRLLLTLGSIILMPFAVLVALTARFMPRPESPRFVFGFQPIINIKYWSQAVQQAGYDSCTVVFGVYHINRKDDFDYVLPANGVRGAIAQLRAFVWLMFTKDIFAICFEGGALSKLGLLSHIEPYLFHIAKKRTIIWPYGSDAYAYHRVQDMQLLTALQMSYPQLARHPHKVDRRIARWTTYGDCVFPGFMMADGVGRFDLVIANFLLINTDMWSETTRTPSKETMVVAHTPNHRGFKGTEFLVEAVKQLREEGLPIELKLLEKVSNDEVKRVLHEEADVLVEQLVYTGHGFSGVEGMASGLPVVCNLENPHYIDNYRRYSFFNECPLVSATPENIKQTLRDLYNAPELRASLGKASRAYALKYHGIDFGAYVFEQITQKIWYDVPVELMQLFHPLSGEYSKRTPLVSTPLIANKLPHDG